MLNQNVKTFFYSICIWSQMPEMQRSERIDFRLTSCVNKGTWLLGKAAKLLHKDVYELGYRLSTGT